MKILLILLSFYSIFSMQPLLAKDASQELVSHSEVRRHVQDVLSVVDTHYVFPETGKAMRSFVEGRVSSGGYDGVGSLNTLIKRVQSDLRDVSNDSHLSLHLAEDRLDRKTHIMPPTELDQQFEVGVVSENPSSHKIGFLMFNKFGGDKETKARIISAMEELATTDSLIIDLRANGGGDPNLARFLSSYFLPKDTHLWSIVNRQGDSEIDAKSMDLEAAYSGELCILISDYTGSAAEAFAYTLKHLGRACIVGEASGGAAHLVQMERVNEEIDIRISVARLYNSITKTNWEGVGVIPTIEVEPEDAKSAAVEYLKAMESM